MKGKHVLINHNSIPRRVGRTLLKLLSALMALLLVTVIAALAVIWVLVKGPSPTAKRLFVLTVNETSAVGFLANIFLPEYEIEQILKSSEPEENTAQTDTSLITLPVAVPPTPDSDSPDTPSDHAMSIAASEDNIEATTASGDDSDGIELVEVNGDGFHGYMMIVQDPTRVFLGTPKSYGGSGVTLENMIADSGAVAGINAGGFDDPDGKGAGGIPDGLVVRDGEFKWGAGEGRVNVIGFDADGILHVGQMTPSEVKSLGLQHAVSFYNGMALVSNGIPQTEGTGRSGISPRTAIGQRADGAVLMLVVEGRQIDSLGATLAELVSIFMDFEAVNAANLDGGSSSLMMLDGEIINRTASVVGLRRLPTAFLVKGENEN